MGPTPDGNEDVRIHVFKSLDSVDDTLNGRMLTDLRKRSAERTPVLQDVLQKLQLFLSSYLFPKRLASDNQCLSTTQEAEEVPF